jgi:oxalate decarboxylase/phosphoglucose isomerase-like protein (cupin superfamily)
MPPIDPASLPTDSFEWGTIKWLVQPATTPGAGVTFGEVVMQPGEGHGRHNHPGSEEILYVLSGHGEQMVDDEPPFEVGPGDTIYIGPDVYHSTTNTGWAPMRVLALYNPAGPEEVLQELDDYRSVPPGQAPLFRRAAEADDRG